MGSLALVPSGLLVFPFTVIWEEQCPRIFGSIYADSRPQIEAKRKAFFRSAVADSLEEVGDKLFIFTHFSKSQW